MKAWLLPTVILALALSDFAHGADLQPLEWAVDGVTRTALIHVPATAKKQPTPVIFVFHGHGGSSRNAARSFHLESEWPEAIVLYPQGLPTAGMLTDPEGRLAGWQARPDTAQNRDLRFFDEMLTRLKREYQVDAKRVFVTGHSNGGSFTYLLWLERGATFAAVAPSSAAAAYASRLPPKPALILGGKNDPLVKFAWQERTMDAVRHGNDCSDEGRPWEKVGTLYPSKSGTPLVTCVFDSGHAFDSTVEPPLIAKFFQQQSP